MWRAYQDLKKPNGLTVINISMPEETVTLRREDQEACGLQRSSGEKESSKVKLQQRSIIYVDPTERETR